MGRVSHVLRSKALQHLEFLNICESESTISFQNDKRGFISSKRASNRWGGEDDFHIHIPSSSSLYPGPLFRIQKFFLRGPLMREKGAMAHLQHNHNLSIAIKVSERELLCRYGRTKFDNMNFTKQTRSKNRGVIHSCSYSTSTSADQQKNLAAQELDPNRRISYRKLHLGYLVNDVDWQVRRMDETQEEMRDVANVQAEAFHQPTLLFDDMFFDFFKAEVLAGLLYRLRNSPPDRYACLVAEQSDNQAVEKEVAGVVDVTVDREGSVLQHLPGAEEYLYVSGIAVLNRFRRKKVATALLKACDKLSAMWGFDYLVLRAYEDDHGARKLYSNAGYKVVSGDLPWMTSWIGRRRRVLMVKQTAKRLEH